MSQGEGFVGSERPSVADLLTVSGGILENSARESGSAPMPLRGEKDGGRADTLGIRTSPPWATEITSNHSPPVPTGVGSEGSRSATLRLDKEGVSSLSYRYEFEIAVLVRCTGRG